MFSSKNYFTINLTLLIGMAILALPAHATISAGQVDDFQNGDNEWGPSANVSVATDMGPGGIGDDAMLINGGLARHGSEDIGIDPSATDQWNGNWTAEGIIEIRMDVRNPNNFELQLRLGFAGTGGPNAFYLGDTYLSANPIIVPADNTWRTISFDVTVSAWANSSGSDAASALQDVTHFRVLHNTNFDFRGAPSQIFIDNITAIAIPEPSTLLMVFGTSVLALLRFNRRAA